MQIPSVACLLMRLHKPHLPHACRRCHCRCRLPHSCRLPQLATAAYKASASKQLCINLGIDFASSTRNFATNLIFADPEKYSGRQES